MKRLILAIIFLTCFQILKAETPVLTLEYKYSNSVTEKNNFIYPNRYNNISEIIYNTDGSVPLFFFGTIIK